ncbi:pantothenate kinase [Thraustotheca clavata]|uniref:pantothenate kinase n=1 Tax=Thraustotheca clavata TaxID=74557 RepID=A0A1W0AA00_9STRA|nr:pantothenate kinase [Thraustotheca clavata]
MEEVPMEEGQQLVRERDAERDRLMKEAFNMKLRINFLEEQLLKYKDGTGFEDEDFESENLHLRTVIEEKVQELERRNYLLVRARDAIEVLRVDLEAAKENNRLNNSTTYSQLEEAMNEVSRLEQEVQKLEDEIQSLQTELDGMNHKYNDLLRRYNELDLEHTEHLRLMQRLEAEKERIVENANWDVQRTKNEMQLTYDAQLNQEIERWHKERGDLLQLWETKVREKENENTRIKMEITDRDTLVKTLQQSKHDLEITLDTNNKQREACENEILNLQQRLMRAASESDDATSLRRQCEILDKEARNLRLQLKDTEQQAQDEIRRMGDEIEHLRAQKQQFLDQMSLQSDKVQWESAKKIEALETRNEQLNTELREATMNSQQLRELLTKAQATADEWETKAKAAATEYDSKLQQLEKIQSSGALLEQEQTKHQERIALLQAELTSAKEADQQLRGSFQLALADIAKNEVLLQEREKSLTAMQQENATLLAKLNEEIVKGKTQRQSLKTKIQTLEAERNQVQLQSKDEANSLALQLSQMHSLKEHFTAKSQIMEAAWHQASGQFQARIDALQDRLGALLTKISDVQTMRDGAQKQWLDEIKREALQAKMKWEQDLVLAQRHIRSEAERADKLERDVRDAQQKLQRVEAESSQKLVRLEVEYQRTIRDVTALKEKLNKSQHKDEHIRLLTQEIEQSRQVQRNLESQLRCAIQDQLPLQNTIKQLEETISKLQEKERTTEQLIRQQCQRTDSILDKTTPLDQLENILRKTRELVHHTDKFQEKHAPIWSRAISSVQLPVEMSNHCIRLLNCNKQLSQRLEQIASQLKVSSSQPVSSSQSSLDALVHSLQDAKAPIMPGTTRLLEAYQSSNSVLARLNKELVKQAAFAAVCVLVVAYTLKRQHIRKRDWKRRISLKKISPTSDMGRSFGLDIGGTLSKIVFFEQSSSSQRPRANSHVLAAQQVSAFVKASDSYGSSGVRDTRLSITSETLGGTLHFIHFETRKMEGAVLHVANHSLNQSLRVVSCTGGGAHKYAEMIEQLAGIQVQKKDEIECLVKGLNFLLNVFPQEVFTFVNVDFTSLSATRVSLVRDNKDEDIFPYILVSIGSGVSVLHVTGPNTYTRVSGSSIGGGTYWGLCRMLFECQTYDEALDLCVHGRNASVDMSVGDIYGGAYEKFNLPATTVASSFGKMITVDRNQVSDADIARSLLVMTTQNIGLIAYLNACIHGTKRIFFVGNFLRHNKISCRTLAYAINFWSKGEMKAHFCRHEGYLGALGAFLSNNNNL